MDSKPELYTHLVPIYEAFQRLNTCRIPGPVGLSQIPWTAINEYAYRHDFEGPEFDRLVHYIEVLDGVFLANLKKPVTKGSK